MTAFLGFVEEHREGWAVLQRELAAGAGGPVAEDVARVRAAIVRRMAALLAPHLGEVRSGALASGFVGAGESLAAWWLDHPGHTREAVAQLIMDVGWRGVGGVLEASVD
jgi:hypothetical protein